MTDRRLIVPTLGPGHCYVADGRQLVGVTTVIGTVLRAPQLEEWMKRVGPQADVIRDEAAAFGKSVDAALTAAMAGARVIPLEMPANWAVTVQAALRWLEANVEEIYAVQQPIASLKYGFAGTPDLYCRRRGHRLPCIIDYKATGGVYWSHLFQTAAYRKAAAETYGDRPAERIILHLEKDTPGKVTPHVLKHHDRDFAGFGYCLGLYQTMKGGMA